LSASSNISAVVRISAIFASALARVEYDGAPSHFGGFDLLLDLLPLLPDQRVLDNAPTAAVLCSADAG
jgi:hypothetical protein